MDLKELTTFRTIIQEGTFSRAAEKLHYAQSTVTHQIQRLEKELGMQLFQRGWDAELTEAGKLYAREIDSLIAHWQHVKDQAQQIAQEEVGTLRLGMIENRSPQLLQRVMRDFTRQKPGIACEITIANTDRLRQAVQERTVDLAVCGEPNDMTSLHFEHLYDEQIQFIVHRDHPLATQQQLNDAHFRQYPLIAGGRQCLYHLQLEREWSYKHIQPFSHTVSQLSAVPTLTAATGGIGAILSSTALPDDMVVLPFALKQQNLSIGLLQLRETSYQSSAVRLLLELIRTTLKQNESHT
ncbi:LysR family transcriptional regulator [Paenibacillus sp. WLX1005]|uniref:LysR family transcriptional regulator n=1 Tax=Paenibacillus sp. WLX1005 TaxID=3243766 RepID=UPI0039843379